MKRFTLTPLLILIVSLSVHAQLPVVQSHPRIWLDGPTKTTLLAKKTSNDPDWVALLAEADDLAARDVLSWNPNNAGIWNTQYIFYSYCGSSWDDAAMALGMAHQLTKGTTTGAFPTSYSDKLLELVDSMLAAYAAYPPCSGCPNMLLWNSSYATRHVGNVLGVAYDWCYDELGNQRQTAMIAMFNDWFNYMRVPYNTYQNTVNPTGNYYFGHVTCAAYLGYATAHDNPLADTMIDWARQRVLGTHSGTLLPDDLTDNWLKQSYTGGIPTGASGSYLGPVTHNGAPQKDGIPVQGWGYGGGNMSRLIDYCMMLRTATNEDIADSLQPYFDATVEAFVHALTPNRFQVDNSNDWGSFVGNFLSYGLPLRIAAMMEGTPMGPQSQYFYETWIQPVTIAATWNNGYPESNWELLLYRNLARPSSAFSLDPFYPVPTDHVTSGPNIDKTLSKYYLREDWSDTATWAALNMSCAFYDDHDHHNAGHFQIVRGDSNDGDDLLLVGANEIGNNGSFGLNGIEGGTCYHMSSSLSNTLFFDDYHDYSEVNTNGYIVGGQSFYGTDQPTHQEQNADFTYVRADLTSAYYRRGELADTVNATLRYFYRSFLYLRGLDLFFSYDNFAAKHSTNPSGQYLKHLRWHFLESPVVNGGNITATKDNSKLYVHTVLPANVSIQTVDESNNPDNTFGPSLNYAFNTYSWRAEVSETGNPLVQNLLTVMQPAALSTPEMTTTAMATNSQDMEGSRISILGKNAVVLFNRSISQYPAPITATTYAFAYQPNTEHVLVGMVPGGTYAVGYDGTTVTVAQSGGGSEIASPSGVLRFTVQLPNGVQNAVAEAIQFQVFPNPSAGLVHCNWSGIPSPSSIVVINTLGQVVQTMEIPKGDGWHTLTIAEPGIYFLTLKSVGKSTTRKVVVLE